MKVRLAERFRLVVLLGVYGSVLCWAYVTYMIPTWGYFGMDLTFVSALDIAAVIVPIAAAGLWAPVAWTQPSAALYWLILTLSYAPMLVGVGLDDKFGCADQLIFSAALVTGMIIASAPFYLKSRMIAIARFNKRDALLVACLLALMCCIYIVAAFHGSLKFASINSEELYELRFSNRNIESAYPLMGYIIMWTGCVLAPILITYGLINKRYIAIILGVAMQVGVYMTLANRAFLLTIPLMIYIYWLTLKPGQENRRLLLSLIASVALVNVLVLIPAGPLAGLSLILGSIFLFRTVFVSSMMAVYYLDFFQTNPLTYYSHIGLISKVIPSPYTEPLGVVVGTNYLNVEQFNANANFMLTDGVAALGLGGIIVAAIMFACLLYLVNCVVDRQENRAALLLFGCASINLMNMSLLTSMTTGGLFLLILWFQGRKYRHV